MTRLLRKSSIEYKALALKWLGPKGKKRMMPRDWREKAWVIRVFQIYLNDSSYSFLSLSQTELEESNKNSTICRILRSPTFPGSLPLKKKTHRTFGRSVVLFAVLGAHSNNPHLPKSCIPSELYSNTTSPRKSFLNTLAWYDLILPELYSISDLGKEPVTHWSVTFQKTSSVKI